MTHVIRRYAGTRLYDVTALRYTTADTLRALMASGAAVVVTDAATGVDVTAAVTGVASVP